MAQLSSARAKVARAIEHLMEANAIASTIFNSYANCVMAVPDEKRNGWFSIIVTKLDPVPEKFVILLGDAAHNLRSALDHIAFTFAKPVSPDKEKDIAFPLVSKRKRFRERANKLLPGVPRKVRAEIQKLQPYHGRKWSHTKMLGQMQSINNWDKHRALLISGVGMANSSFRVSCDPPTPIVDQKFFIKRPFKEGAVVARFQLAKHPGEVEVNVVTGFVIGPVLDKKMPRDVRGIPVLGVLKTTADFIESDIIPRFEKFL